MTDYPHITVATVIEDDGKFLMVKEWSNDELVINQPAGHLELGETLAQAAVRETLEETTWQVELTAFLGIYHFTSAANGITYVRHCFIAKPIKQIACAQLDADIEEACWMTLAGIRSTPLRSPLVGTAVTDYLSNVSYPLSILKY